MEGTRFPEKRIVLWSHPRSVSTAFELVFEERADTEIVHEPCARLRHRRSLQRVCPDPEVSTKRDVQQKIFWQLLGPHEKPLLFVKDMAYYVRRRYYDVLLPPMTNTFILRNPEESLISHYKKFSRFTFEQAGYAAMEEMHDYVTNTLRQPSVIVDGNDFRRHPTSVLRQYCHAVGITHDERTEKWVSGNVKGWEIWQHQGWHREAERSTGIIPPKESTPDVGLLPRRVRNMLPECRRIYEKLFALRMKPDDDPRYGMEVGEEVA